MNIIDGEIVGASRAAVYLEWWGAIGSRAVTRRQMANEMNVTYTTARYHLERAVSEGVVNKYYGMASDNQPGWVYMQSEKMPRLEGI